VLQDQVQGSGSGSRSRLGLGSFVFVVVVVFVVVFCLLSFVFCLGYLDGAAAAGRSPSWRPAVGSVGALASSAVEQHTVPVARHHLRINELVLGLG
jgi:hypothetical protein